MRALFGYGKSLRAFNDPVEVLVARNTVEAWRILDGIEGLLSAGYALAGYLSYELGYACLELPLPKERPKQTRSPLLELGVFRLSDRYEIGKLGESPSFCASPAVPRQSKAAYTDVLGHIAHSLYTGDTYQVNYTVPFDFSYCGEPLDAYRRLCAGTQAAYTGYVENTDRAIVSLSPELFLRVTPTTLETKPMKGTAALDHVADLQNAKNRAEHVMIVDLLRNDLGQVCRDVNVSALFTVETYPTFATMTSTITGTRTPGTSFSEIVRALFPCGSVTGAPKRSAVRLLGELEPQDRQAYCGSVGYLLPNGTGSWNVAIRTLQLDKATKLGRLDIGGGIVADSRADQEWEELLIKRRFFEELNDG